LTVHQTARVTNKCITKCKGMNIITDQTARFNSFHKPKEKV